MVELRAYIKACVVWVFEGGEQGGVAGFVEAGGLRCRV